MILFHFIFYYGDKNLLDFIKMANNLQDSHNQENANANNCNYFGKMKSFTLSLLIWAKWSAPNFASSTKVLYI